MDEHRRGDGGAHAAAHLWTDLEDRAASLSEDARMVLVRMSIVPEKIQRLFKCLCLLLGVGPGMPSRKGSRLARHISASDSSSDDGNGSGEQKPGRAHTGATTPGDGSGDQDHDSHHEHEDEGEGEDEDDGSGLSEDFIACARSLLKKPFFTSILLETRTAFCTKQAMDTALAELKRLDEPSMYKLSHAAGIIYTWCIAVTTAPQLPPHSP